LIDDLLDYESIDAGLLELDPRPFSPRQLHTDLRQFVELLPRHPGLDLRFDYDGPDELFLVGDVGRLRQVLLNLASNALKFTPRGWVALRVRTRCDGDNCDFTAEVEDSGIGINPKRKDLIFDSFVQGESGTSRRYEGSGLGLTISKRLAELMDAKLEFESEPDEGTLFRLTLNLPILANGQRPDAALGDWAAPDVEALRGTRVLVVEDTSTNLLITRLLLEEMGCHVASARDGIEAVDLLGSTAQHVVLMDLQMAPWDGFETTRRIRKAEDYQQLGHDGRIPIIAVTADVSPLARKQAESAGCDAFVAKPFTREELITALWRELPRIPQGGRELTGQTSIAPISAPLLLQAAHGQQGLAIKRLETFQRQIVTLLHDLQSPQAGNEASQTKDLRGILEQAEELGLGEIAVALSELLVAFATEDQERRASLLERCWEAHRELERRALHIRQSFETAAYPRGKTQEFPDIVGGQSDDD
jgi:CheY-like chemotaxis protein/anti-sigma regulatory factor (Ser/Thr protein kinase)